MDPAVGASLGLFFVACIIVGTFFGATLLIVCYELWAIRRGMLQFSRAWKPTQYMYLMLFDDADGGGYA